MSYRRRLESDLDRWIDAGFVPAASRSPILADIASERRVTASVALAVIGALLLGAAVIAFVAANWDVIPRGLRFTLILGLFLSICGAAARTCRRRPLFANTLLAVAGLIYAAAIGLTGQIFDIAGDPQAALRGAGLAAGLLALAGRSSAAAVVALLFLALGEFAGGLHDQEWRWLIFAAPVAGVAAWRWRSVPLAHAASFALIVGVGALMPLARGAEGPLAAAAALGALAAAMWFAPSRLGPVAFVWLAGGALVFFGFGGVDAKSGWLIAHRGGWLLLGGGLTALGLHVRRSAVTAVGVAAMIAAVCVILADLGLRLMAAAALFATCALIALVAGALLHRRVRT